MLDCHMQKPANVTVSTAMNQICYLGCPLWADVAEKAIMEFATEKILCNSKKARDLYEKEHTVVVIEKVTEALVILGPWLYLEILSLSQHQS
jgi:hypothetical protein